MFSSKSEVPHIVITGIVTLEALKNFTKELFHEDHGSEDKIGVILQTKDPTPYMDMFLHN